MSIVFRNRRPGIVVRMERSYSFSLSKQVTFVSKLCVRVQWVVFSVCAMFLFSMPFTATDEHCANLLADVREILVALQPRT